MPVCRKSVGRGVISGVYFHAFLSSRFGNSRFTGRIPSLKSSFFQEVVKRYYITATENIVISVFNVMLMIFLTSECLKLN